MDQLFQVFVDERTEARDMVIKMYYTEAQSEEHFLCVDIGEEAVDFMPPTEYPPTRFVLNIPACHIKASSMEIHEIERKTKVLTNGLESLSNRTQWGQELEVSPPSESIN